MFQCFKMVIAALAVTGFLCSAPTAHGQDDMPTAQPLQPRHGVTPLAEMRKDCGAVTGLGVVITETVLSFTTSNKFVDMPETSTVLNIPGGSYCVMVRFYPGIRCLAGSATPTPYCSILSGVGRCSDAACGKRRKFSGDCRRRQPERFHPRSLVMRSRGSKSSDPVTISSKFNGRWPATLVTDWRSIISCWK